MTKLYLALLLIANMALAEPQNTWQISTLDSNNSLRGSAIYQQTLWVSGSNNAYSEVPTKAKAGLTSRSMPPLLLTLETSRFLTTIPPL